MSYTAYLPKVVQYREGSGPFPAQEFAGLADRDAWCLVHGWPGAYATNEAGRVTHRYGDPA